ncbi:MAG: MFS transporter [Chloroflexales bacterium]|nr:MFS transporter [Chloroflexales bacterium]
MFRNRLYLAVVSGHFIVDVLNSMGAVLLAVLAGPLGLTNAQIGLALTIYLLAGALSQPIFGWLSDRLPGREMLLGGISVAWMAAFFCAVAIAPNWTLLLPFFLLAALGSGLFHPIGTATAATIMPERASSATAVFFFGGQMGLAVGPALGGLLFREAGSLGVLPLVAAAIIPATMLFLAARYDPRATQPQPTPAASNTTNRQTRKTTDRPTITNSRFLTLGTLIVVAFVTLVAVRSSIQATYQAFLPKLFEDRSWDPALYGLLAGVYMGAAAIGNVCTGTVADRFGMRTATVWPLLLSVPAGIVCVLAPSVPLTFLACALAGVLVGGQHSVLVVHAQRLLPVKQGFAAGLILGFTFASGAIGTWFVGLAADVYGLPLMMQVITSLGVVAALLALTLPGHERRGAIAVAGVEPSAATARETPA